MNIVLFTKVILSQITEDQGTDAEGSGVLFDPMLLPNTLIKTGETLLKTGNELGVFVQYTGAAKTILTNAKKTFKNLEVYVNEAKQRIENMNMELKRLDKSETQFYRDEYFPQFNSAKSQLRQVRLKLRKLADKTVTDTRDLKILFDLIDQNNRKDSDGLMLTIALESMKNLMVITEDRLSEAYKLYNTAILKFENLNSSIQTQNHFIKKLANTESEEHKAWVKKVRLGGYISSVSASATGFAIADAFGCMGICSTVGNLIVIGASAATIEATISQYTAELNKFEGLTAEMLRSGKEIDKTMRVAIKFINEEIEILDRWGNNVDTITTNMKKFPEEYLRKFAGIRTIFRNGLDDLQQTACDFLNRGQLFDAEDDTDNVDDTYKEICTHDIDNTDNVQETPSPDVELSLPAGDD